MPILTAGYVDRAIGTSTRIGLVGTASSAGSAFAQHEAAARSVVQSRAALKGYSVPTDSTNDFVRLLTLGQWYFFAAGLRKGMEVPPAIDDAIKKLDEVSRKENALPIPGMTPNVEDAVGGVKFSDSSASGRVQYFSREKMRGWMG